MYHVFVIFATLFLTSCTSAGNEKKNNISVQNDTIAETPIAASIANDSVYDTEEIINTEAKDSVIGTIKSEDQEEQIPETPKKDQIEEKKTLTKPSEEQKEEEVQGKNEPLKPDHTIWNILTKNYVSAGGKVDYKGFSSKISEVEAYLEHLQQTPPQKDWNKNEKLAYWFNLYNAATIQLVTEAYPVKSIKNISNGKPWDKKFIKSGNEVYSLNEIENTVVRPNFDESRLHVAFNCAAVSCPKLLNEAFSPSRLDEQLNKLSKAWINDPTKNKIANDHIVISKIFEWYAIDFKKGIIPFINQHSETKVNSDAEIQYLEYNWNLND